MEGYVVERGKADREGVQREEGRKGGTGMAIFFNFMVKVALQRSSLPMLLRIAHRCTYGALT